MAVLFDDGSSEYLQHVYPIVDTPPFSFSGWFRTDDLTTGQVIVAAADTATNDNRYMLQFWGTQAGDPVRAFAQSSSPAVAASAVSTTGVSVNTWHHACAVFTSTSSRTIYLDGGSSATDLTSCVPVYYPDNISVGRTADSTPGGYFSGRIADVGVWADAALTAEEAAVMASGYSAGFVRPESLTYWYPLFNTSDLISYGRTSNALTAYNTPTTADGPPIVYPSGAHTPWPNSVVAWLESGRLFLYTAANWGYTRTWYFEATLKATVGTARAKLYDVTAASYVTDSEVTTTSSTKTRVRSSAITLTDGHTYEVHFGALPAATCAAHGACLVGVGA
jgi:hypothetical protein